MQIGIKQGMRLMDVSLAELVHKGSITAEEAILHVEDQVEFLKTLAKTAPAEDVVDEEDDDG
jgi:Tfp pilus assembly pilus retraction ATPase PilT